MDSQNSNVYSEEAREAQREYYRKWRAQNKEKVREKNRKYWEKKAAQLNSDKKD